ncbi:type 1 glutamine amidotransferase [Ectothiorhodospiraceae bacterium BW-2]|nr:type 1 glutamine amidotransferase [Ectothiorhodospiraceae bacterium BW-2]
MPQALILQHVPFEGAGSIESWLNTHHYSVHYCQLYNGDPLPDPDTIDLLIIMGGPMSVNDEADYPWLADEKLFIATAIQMAVPTLGICLGAQLIANALGAAVYLNPVKEIGWFKVNAVASTLPLPPQFNAFHWHGETFDLPPGSQHIARSSHCLNQGFSLGDRVIGLQFHLETTPESATALIENCRDELNESDTIQSETAILAAPASHYQQMNQIMAALLGRLTSSVP